MFCPVSHQDKKSVEKQYTLIAKYQPPRAGAALRATRLWAAECSDAAGDKCHSVPLLAKPQA